MALEPALAAVLTILGVVLTSFGVLTHLGQAVAPGSLLTLAGGAWLGNYLARRDVRLLPTARRTDG
jgi:hypothetical protein